MIPASNPTKPMYCCEYIRLSRDLISGKIRLVIKRLDDHERLGPPVEGKYTITSPVVEFSLEDKWAETENSMYYWNN